MNTSQGLSSLFIAGLYDFVPAACSYSGAQILASTRRTSSILVYCSTRIHAMKYKSLVVLRGCVTRLSSLDSLLVRARPDSKGETLVTSLVHHSEVHSPCFCSHNLLSNQRRALSTIHHHAFRPFAPHSHSWRPYQGDGRLLQSSNLHNLRSR